MSPPGWWCGNLLCILSQVLFGIGQYAVWNGQRVVWAGCSIGNVLFGMDSVLFSMGQFAVCSFFMSGCLGNVLLVVGSVQCVMASVQCVMGSVQCAVCKVWRTQCNGQFIVVSKWSAMCFMQRCKFLLVSQVLCLWAQPARHLLQQGGELFSDSNRVPSFVTKQIRSSLFTVTTHCNYHYTL